MFELPLFPFRQSYGKVQRQLAGEFNVILIPKRFLAGILLTPDGTVDGLHLSDAGHQQMADLVWSLTRLSEDAKPCHPE